METDAVIRVSPVVCAVLFDKLVQKLTDGDGVRFCQLSRGLQLTLAFGQLDLRDPQVGFFLGIKMLRKSVVIAKRLEMKIG